MTAEDNKALATETAEALLTAIRSAAPSANDRGTGALKELAEAFALVREAMPKPQPAPGRAR